MTTPPDHRSLGGTRDRQEPGTDAGAGTVAGGEPGDWKVMPGEGRGTTTPPRTTVTTKPGNRRRRNRRGTERTQAPPIQKAQGVPAGMDDGAGQPPGTRATSPGPPPDQERATAGPRRAEPAHANDRIAPSPDRPRRTEGTRPPDQGNGRGLSGSPRNPNHYGEIPIRPDNRVFDGSHDRLVCIARSHVIPEDFPVQYRRATASSRLAVVATSGSDLLLCDRSHSGPHIWPDQTAVQDPAEPVHGHPSGQSPSVED